MPGRLKPADDRRSIEEPARVLTSSVEIDSGRLGRGGSGNTRAGAGLFDAREEVEEELGRGGEAPDTGKAIEERLAGREPVEGESGSLPKLEEGESGDGAGAPVGDRGPPEGGGGRRGEVGERGFGLDIVDLRVTYA